MNKPSLRQTFADVARGVLRSALAVLVFGPDVLAERGADAVCPPNDAGEAAAEARERRAACARLYQLAESTIKSHYGGVLENDADRWRFIDTNVRMAVTVLSSMLVGHEDELMETINATIVPVSRETADLGDAAAVERVDRSVRVLGDLLRAPLMRAPADENVRGIADMLAGVTVADDMAPSSKNAAVLALLVASHGDLERMGSALRAAVAAPWIDPAIREAVEIR